MTNLVARIIDYLVPRQGYDEKVISVRLKGKEAEARMSRLRQYFEANDVTIMSRALAITESLKEAEERGASIEIREPNGTVYPFRIHK